MERLDHQIRHAWHVAINQFNEGRKTFSHFLYDAKDMADEIPRLVLLFRADRKGELPKLHQQCSCCPKEEIPNNHLTCCLGVKCRDCEYLRAIEKAHVGSEVIDELKAWTCAAHIQEEHGKRHIDTSEGYVLTVSDRMYWDRVYDNLRQEPV